jgi:hypothetical protein
LGRVTRLPAWTLSAVLAGLYLALDPRSADLAAQTYRTWLFEHAGWTVWDGGWYAGHHVPAYSILFPPLAALLGPRLAGALAAVAAAWAFERIVADAEPRAGARLAALWFAAATAVSLVTGRLTFALGLAFGVAAVLAFTRRRTALAALLAAGTALASPVAGGFLALVVVAVLAGRPRSDLPRAGLVVAAAVVPAIALAWAFPEGGDFPFVADAFWPSLAATLLLLVVLPGRHRALRAGIVLYALLLIASAAINSPMGGNAVRLGALLAGPLAALALWPERRRLLLLLAPVLLYWQWSTPADDWWRAREDPSVHASYYTGMLRFLESRAGEPFRVEIPFTDNHWEAAVVAPHLPLARGWERQLDRKVNALFYDDRPLTPARYRRWLDDNAVRYVALADAPVDYSAAEEAALVRARPSYLRPAYADAHWRVYEVAAARPLADGARVTRHDVDRIDLVAPRAGRVALRVRWTPYWRITRGRGCVARSGDWTVLRLRNRGAVTLRTDFALGRIRAEEPRCTTG